MQQKIGKNNAAFKAVDFIEDGMIVGLGTGSTAAYFIEHLIEKCERGLKIHAVATSNESKNLALKGNIPLIDINSIKLIDITVDGADEIDPKKNLIKGAGGALLREKIVAGMSREMIVIADESKLTERLGKALLPIEVLPFGATATICHLETLGLKVTVRGGNTPFITDNKNYIFDLKLPKEATNLELLDQKIKAIPGVLETGFFFHMAKKVIIGFQDGKIKIW